MSDSCMYELEDIVWEELGDNDDHIVPHAVGKDSGYGVESDSCKRPRYELISSENNVDNKNASNNAVQRKEEICPVKQDKEIIMLEKNPWPQPSSGGAISASLVGDPNRKAPLSISDEAMSSNQWMNNTNVDSTVCEVHGDDPTLGDQNPPLDNNLCQYQLNNAGQMENDLGLLGSNLQDKENGDLLYYMWPELENFEDVDSMFRNCDSTFGLELDNNDELGLFSSSQAAEESEDTLKSSFSFSASDLRAINIVKDHPELFEQNNAGLIGHEVDKKPNSVSWKSSEKGTYNDSSIAVNSSCSDGSGVIPSIRGDLQVRSYVSQSSRNEKASEGKGKDQSIHFGSLKQESEADQSVFQCSLWAEAQQKDVLPQAGLQTHLPLINSNAVHPTNQVLSGPWSSKIKSEDSGLPSLSPRESSHASNHMQSAESPHDVSFQQPATLQATKKEMRRLYHGSDKHNLMVPGSDSDPFAMQKQVAKFENEVDGQSEVNCSDIGFTGELDSSNIQESSCMSSVLDEVSIEASSFQQLQHVLEQLDIRTKLCIRDSLYRLARSAEQRHKCVNPSSISRDNKDPGGVPISHETSKSAEFMDIETDTNPIDRSIAHLLFHRPSDPSVTGVLDDVPAKPHTMVQARSIGPVMGEKFGFQEETTSSNMKGLKNECENCDN